MGRLDPMAGENRETQRQQRTQDARLVLSSLTLSSMIVAKLCPLTGSLLRVL